MKIAINALSAHTGAGVSLMIELLPCLSKLDCENQYLIFYSSFQKEFVESISMPGEKIFLPSVPSGPLLRGLWEQLIFPFYLFKHRVTLLYSVGNTTSLFSPCSVVLVIENANPYSKLSLDWTVKEKLRLRLLYFLTWLSARRAVKIRFVSQNSKNLIVKSLKIPATKCFVISHGLSEMRIKVDSSKTGSDILTIGANGPHRNTFRLLQAFFILRNQYNYQGNLIVVGNTGSVRHFQALKILASQLQLSDQIRFVGEVPHYKIGFYFKQAAIFVFPSLEETFGIPLLEAMAVGVPIAAADCDLEPVWRGQCFNPFREICQSAADYFNPFSVHDMAKSMAHVLTDLEYRRELSARGFERVKSFALATTSQALVSMFHSLYTK